MDLDVGGYLQEHSRPRYWAQKMQPERIKASRNLILSVRLYIRGNIQNEIKQASKHTPNALAKITRHASRMFTVHLLLQ